MVPSASFSSSNQRNMIVRTVIKSFTTVLCAELENLEKAIEKKRKKRSVWVRSWLKKKYSGATNIIKELYHEDPREYKAVMRLTPDQFEFLLNLIGPKIQRNDTVMREALLTRTKLEIFLTFLATGMSFRMLSIMFRVSKAAISKLIPEICDTVCEELKDFKKIPSAEEWKASQVGFHEKWNFPGCCGSIDGKHIVIQAPPNCGSEFYNYKGTNSIVLMAIVDHDYCFQYIDIGSYGRNLDGGVFQNCSLYPLLENNLLPEGGALVGDDAFPLKSYLLKPYKTVPSYNYRLSRARRIVENAFGIISSRFQVLRKPIQLQEPIAIKIVQSICTLHNWLRKTAPNSYTPPGSVDYEDIINFTVTLGQWRSEISVLPSLRRSRINNRSKKLGEKVREKYRDYFCGEGAVAWQNNMIAN